MWLLYTFLASAVVITGIAPADQAVSPAQRLEAVQREVAVAEDAFEKAKATLKDPARGSTPEVDRVLKAYREREKAGFAEALEIAEAQPSSETGFQALEWILMEREYLSRSPVGVRAIQLLHEHHAANPKVGRVVAMISHFPPSHEVYPSRLPTKALLKAVAADNPDRTARGEALLGLAEMTKFNYLVAQYQNLPEEAQLKAKAEDLYERVLRDYGDCPSLYEVRDPREDGTIGNKAKLSLYELRHLQPGDTAPEIVGNDLRGRQFALSDYRGKVVVLVFWGSWCGGCLKAMPHEREIAERYEGRPFAFVGVNADRNPEDALRTMEREGLDWRCFWNGPDGMWGPVSGAWNVRSWPTTYVIDHEGVIRHFDLSGTELDEALEKLVSEAEASQ